MQKQKILYIHRDGSRGGSILSLLHLVEQLNKRLYEPVVLFYDASSPQLARFEAAGAKVVVLDGGLTYQKSGLEQMRLGNALEGRSMAVAQFYRFFKSIYRLLRRDLVRAWRIKQVIMETRPDLVHHNHWGQENVLAARLAGVPQVCHMRALGKMGPVERWLVRSVTSFIYVSEALAAYYTAQGIPARQGRTILNGVDLETFAPVKDAAALRREFGLAPADRLIVNVGRLVGWKGFEFFLQAVARLKPAFPTLKALVVGEADDTPASQAYKRELHALAHRLGLADTVTFTGYRTDVACIMAGAEVVVHSATRLEPGGRALIEAMVAGTPVVGTDNGGILDIAQDGVHALLVPAKDVPAMAGAIEKLLTNPSLARQMSLAAHRKVLECCTSKRNALAVQEVYQAVFNQTMSPTLERVNPHGVG